MCQVCQVCVFYAKAKNTSSIVSIRPFGLVYIVFN